MSSILSLVFSLIPAQVPAAPPVPADPERAEVVFDLSLEETGRLAELLLDEGLGNRGAYQMLAGLIEAAPKRLSGTQGFRSATEWGAATMKRIGLTGVHLQPVKVPHWERGKVERCYATLADGSRLDLAVCALGGSIATPKGGLTAQIVEVDGLEGLSALKGQLEGKIAFFNRPMDPLARTSFSAYGGAVGQRVHGAALAAKLGAAGVIVRSMSTLDDDAPHTGAMSYREGIRQIPAAALGIQSADRLTKALRKGQVKEVLLELDCQSFEDSMTGNVVGEIRGSVYPDQYIVVGGHLDSWDTGDGAHDDGAGCVHSLEAARLLIATGWQPRHSIRVVLFANEEFGLRGGNAYARDNDPEKHFFAYESDSGGFKPRGVSLNLPEMFIELLRPHGAHFEIIGAESVFKGGGGADIGPLKRKGVPVGSLRPEDARYFDLHHSSNDVLANVNSRELELGAVVTAYWLALVDRFDSLAIPGTGAAVEAK